MAHQLFDCMACVDAFSILMGASLGVLMTWFGYGVWSIASMELSHAIVKISLAWIMSSSRMIAVREGEQGGEFS